MVHSPRHQSGAPLPGWARAVLARAGDLHRVDGRAWSTTPGAQRR